MYRIWLTTHKTSPAKIGYNWVSWEVWDWTIFEEIILKYSMGCPSWSKWPICWLGRIVLTGLDLLLNNLTILLILEEQWAIQVSLFLLVIHFSLSFFHQQIIKNINIPLIDALQLGILMTYVLGVGELKGGYCLFYFSSSIISSSGKRNSMWTDAASGCNIS